MRNLDSCRCWRCTLCSCKVRNKFLVYFWNRNFFVYTLYNTCNFIRRFFSLYRVVYLSRRLVNIIEIYNKYSTTQTHKWYLQVACNNFTFMWPCIVTNWFVIKPTRCTNFTNLLRHETLHVSDSSSVHHQEYTQQWYMSYRFVDSFRAGPGWNRSSILILLESCLQTCILRNCPKHVEFHDKINLWN